VQFAYDADKDIAFMSRKPRPAERPDNKDGWCQMPLSRSTTCEDCTLTFYNCPKHVKQCGRPVWIACANPLCMRFLCWEHMVCYCEKLGPMPTAPTPDSGLLSASESCSVATARKPMTVPTAADDAMPISKTVPAAEDAMLMPGDACPSASEPLSVDTARMPKKPVDVLSASETSCLSTARELDPVVDVPKPAVRRSSRLVHAAERKTPVLPAVSVSKIAANVEAPPSKRVPPTARCATPVMSAEPVSMSKIAANVKVPLRASKRVPPAARCATPTVCRTDVVSMYSVENKNQVTSLSVDSILAENNRSRCLETDAEENTSSAEEMMLKMMMMKMNDEEKKQTDAEENNSSSSSAVVYKPQNRKRLAGAHCKRSLTGRGSMQASGAHKISPGHFSKSRST
jgi:hypothetical protein